MKKNKNVIKVCIFTGVICILCISISGIYHLYFYDNENFPTDYLETEGSYKKIMNISCDMEKLEKFYEHFTNVDIGGNSILLKMESGQTIKITLEGQKVKFEEE